MPQYCDNPSPMLSPAFHLPPDSDIRISDHSFIQTISTRPATTAEFAVAFWASRLIGLPYPPLFAPGKLVAVALRFRFTTWRLLVPNLPEGVLNQPVVTV